MTKTLKIAWASYVLIVVAMISTSLITGRRATRLAGAPHYLLTRKHIFVETTVAPTDKTDAELDALFEEAGEPATLTVARPVFVLGLLDATAPIAILGCAALAIVTVIARRRRAAGKPSAEALS